MAKQTTYTINPSRKELELARRLRRTIYVVIDGTSGYMPNIARYFSNKRAAQSYAYELASIARQNDYSVTGNAQDGYICTPQWSDHPLDNVIEINQVRLGDLGLSEKEVLHDPLDNILDKLNGSF